VILCGFAVIVGVLTTRQIASDFNRQVAAAADELQRSVQARLVLDEAGAPKGIDINRNAAFLEAYAASFNAVIRIVTSDGEVLKATQEAPYLPPPRAATEEFGGFRIESRGVPVTAFSRVYIQYARRLSDVRSTANRVKVFLGLGVLGGAALALLAGLATATRAMAPITRLTAVARSIARTRDPTLRIPRPQSEDEVAELARTFEGMLHALESSRAATEATLQRQREFVADASHELRTPLTSVLANLELLEEELEGEPREAAASALRSSRRMRRLVADLLLLARADAGRKAAPHVPLDLSEVLTEAAGELEPVAGDHPITVAATPGARVQGARDELHRLALNLLENALRHTDPGTAVEATVERRDGHVVLAVEDDGPGIPPELEEKVFERFFRGAGDRSGSSGLGLAIVRAVAESHHGDVRLEPPLDGRGARFVVRLPAHAQAAGPARS
jgi:signal transduction histidine kinase